MNPENNKDVNKDVNYEPLNGSKLDGLLKNSKGIESLWKKIKDNKDGQKSTLYSNEKNLAEMSNDFIKAFENVKQQNNGIELGKNFQSKTAYNNMVTTLLNGDTKTATEFIKKFPHWTLQVCSLFFNSTHFKRISTGVSGAKMGTDDITSDSNFNVFKKDSKQKTGRESKSEKSQKGILKQISLFWNRHFKKGGWGKASKSKVTIELQKFGKDVNEPWRKWWEVIASPSDKLSNSEPKSRLKEALGKSTVGGQKKAVLNLFNMGQPSGDKEQTPAKHNKSISGFDDNTENFSVDGKHVMFNVFTSLDKSLGNKVRKLFNAPVIEEKSFIKGLLGKKSKDAEKTATATATEMQNLNENDQPPQTLEQIISSNAAPQPGGNFNKINSIVQNLPQNGKGGNAEILIQIAESVSPKIQYDQNFKLDRVDGYLIPIAKFIGLPNENCNRKYIENNLCKKLKKDPTPQESLINKIRNIIVECWNDKDYGFGELGVHKSTGDHLPPIPKKRQKK